MSLPSRETLVQSIPAQLPPIIPLTTNASSWLLYLPGFAKPPPTKGLFTTESVFSQVFQTHPPNQHALQMYGKRVLENRYSEMFVIGRDGTGTGTGTAGDANDSASFQSKKTPTTPTTYRYSGTTRPCHVCNPNKPEENFILDLCHVSNLIYSKLQHQKKNNTTGGSRRPDAAATSSNNNIPTTTDSAVYNACLVNWYQPHHHIGLHSDDERELNGRIPIVSLSWGGPRRFLLRPKQTVSSLTNNNLQQRLHPYQFPTTSKSTRRPTTQTSAAASSSCFEILLRDGDLLLMGGKCQQEFKHEIPKVRKTMDGLVGPRISWTIRSMHTTSTTSIQTPIGTSSSTSTPRQQDHRTQQPAHKRAAISQSNQQHNGGAPTSSRKRMKVDEAENKIGELDKCVQ